MHFYPTIELDEPLRIRIGHLEGRCNPLPYSALVADPVLALSFRGSRAPTSLVVEAQVYGAAAPQCVPVRTAYRPPPPAHRASALKLHQWNEWLELPVRLSQLPHDSCVLLTVWGPSGTSEPAVYCGAVLPLFNNRVMSQGRQKLGVSLGRHARDLVREPSKPADSKLERLEKLLQAQQMGQVATVGWLDALVFRRIEALAASEGVDSHALFVELPLWDYDVLWFSRKYAMSARPGVSSSTQQLSTSVSLLGPNNKVIEDEDPIMAVYDPDFGRETPIEAKYRRLVRLSNIDKDMRPNARVRDELERIIAFSPAHELSSDDKILVWKYRYYLTKRKQALTKFVKSVAWDDEGEAAQAVEVLRLWVDIDVADALELLGPEVQNTQVRAYAVDRLRTAADHDLELYLLQLVEALKFERWTGSPPKSYLARFLENRAVLNPMLGNFFYWYVSVQSIDPTYGAEIYQPVLRHYLAALPRTSYQMQIQKRLILPQQQQEIQAMALKHQQQTPVTAATSSSGISTGLTTAAATETGTAVAGTSTTTAPPLDPMSLKQVELQVAFMNKLLDLAKIVKQSKEARPRRIAQMREWIADPRNELVKFAPTRLPLDPSIIVVGCISEQCTVFKSSMLPLKIVLKTEGGGQYALIFKSGDDLRQDQLVMQIIQLMDQLLRKENLDLKLMPYRILATSRTDGAMQFIPNEPLAHIISQHHGILPFLRMHAADSEAPLGVRPDVMENFVRSAAGYAVITYLLGVGDRHLDNLLLDYRGHFFHIDFGYILGKDPKPFPPMIKLPIQLIDGMGGINSENYTRFRSYCFTAFTTLRKSANLILALFNLMTESTIPNIMTERDQAVHKVEERFCLEMSEEEAILHFQNLINDSVNAFLPMVIDRLHSLAQYWRA